MNQNYFIYTQLNILNMLNKMDPNKTIIPQQNIYTIDFGEGSTKLFFIKINDGRHDITYRDLYVDLNKNSVYNLKIIAKYCKLTKYSSLHKQELVQLIRDNIIFENI